MKTADLGGPLLASVSRSFYLTVRVLPARLRAPIGLAYLLARASDTIADTADAPSVVRLRHLAAFDGMIQTGTTAGLAELQRAIRPPSASEQQLIASLDRCLAWLAEIQATDQHEIAAVLAKITRGQSLDLDRFEDAQRVTALPTAAELEEYTYLVAGCVGEFWTRICLRHLARYSSLDPEELARLGANFGKGLQLVNILRDAPADLRAGRCYLPADELRSAGLEPARILAQAQLARPVFERWQARAEALLDDGFRYIEALRPARLRVACFLPWFLGVETLRLLRARPPLECGVRVKVPRSTVYRALRLAIPIALSDRALRALRPKS